MVLQASWTVAGGWGVIDTAQAGAEFDDLTTPEQLRSMQIVSGVTEPQAFAIVAGQEEDVLGRGAPQVAPLMAPPVAPLMAPPMATIPAGQELAELDRMMAASGNLPAQRLVAGTTMPVNGTQMGFPLVAGAVIGGKALLLAIRAIAGRFLTVGVFKSLVSRFGPVAVKLAIGSLAFLGLSALIEAGADDSAGVAIPKKRKRYSIGHNPRVRTLARVAGHVQRMIKRHEKVIREFLPKKKVTYGIPPSRVLSAIEKAAIRG